MNHAAEKLSISNMILVLAVAVMLAVAGYVTQDQWVPALAARQAPAPDPQVDAEPVAQQSAAAADEPAPYQRELRPEEIGVAAAPASGGASAPAAGEDYMNAGRYLERERASSSAYPSAADAAAYDRFIQRLTAAQADDAALNPSAQGSDCIPSGLPGQQEC